MKKIAIVLSFILFIPLILLGQKPGQTGTNMRLFENSRPLNLPDGEGNNLEIPLEQIEGSPYLNEGFFPGKIYNNQENQGTFLIRYNIYNDVMEIQFAENSIQELIVDPDLKVSINTSRFRVHDYLDDYNNLSQGYFEILEDGEQIDLLVKHRVVFSPAEPARSGYHKAKKNEFDYSKEFYLFFNDENKPVKIKKLKEKRVLELLDKKKEAREIIAEEQLDLGEAKDLRKLINRLNQISA